jgi:hypothetical protein
MATALTAMPATITAGATVKYTAQVPDYPASSGWVFDLYLAGASITDAVRATTSANGRDYDVVLPAATTQRLISGAYTYEERVSKAGEVYVVGAATIAVKANIAAAKAGDMQTWEERTLVVVEAVLAGRITADVQAYQISGRAVTKIPVMELRAMRAELVAAVRQQKRGSRIGEVRVSFGSGANR